MIGFLLLGIEEGIKTDINKFFTGKEVSEIRVGQSGANVYEIDGSLILKHVQRDKLKNNLHSSVGHITQISRWTRSETYS